MSKKPEPYQLEPWRKELLARAFKGLPQDYDALSPALSALRKAFFTNVATTLDPAIHTHFQSAQADTFAERKRLAGWVDRVTREHGVTTADPDTGKPGLLVAERSIYPEVEGNSHYSLLVRTARYNSGFNRGNIKQNISNVHLIPAPPNITEMFEGLRPQQSGRRNL